MLRYSNIGTTKKNWKLNRLKLSRDKEKKDGNGERIKSFPDCHGGAKWAGINWRIEKKKKKKRKRSVEVSVKMLLVKNPESRLALCREIAARLVFGRIEGILPESLSLSPCSPTARAPGSYRREGGDINAIDLSSNTASIFSIFIFFAPCSRLPSRHSSYNRSTCQYFPLPTSFDIIFSQYRARSQAPCCYIFHRFLSGSTGYSGVNLSMRIRPLLGWLLRPQVSHSSQSPESIDVDWWPVNKQKVQLWLAPCLLLFCSHTERSSGVYPGGRTFYWPYRKWNPLACFVVDWFLFVSRIMWRG